MLRVCVHAPLHIHVEHAHNVCKINVVHNAMRPLDSRQTSNSELN